MKLKIIIGIIVIIAAIAFLIIGGMKETAVYYLTVSEAVARSNPDSSRGLRISGDVVNGSIDWRPSESRLNFMITDYQDTLRVVYAGMKPDQLVEDQQVIAEGRMRSDGTFQAGSLMTKCPSKYETKDRGY